MSKAVNSPVLLSPVLESAMLAQLEAAGYRFTRAFQAPSRYAADVRPATLKRALILDTETTGLDSAVDRIVELGLVLVEYDPFTGQAYDVLDTFNGLEDPGMPISPEAMRVHGISDEMVRGQRIADADVERLVVQADWVIAHNSKFDRVLAERRWTIFAGKPWACSLTQIPWRDEGLGSTKLEYIAYRHGFHYAGHRAVEDGLALLEVLQRPLPHSGELAMAVLLRNAEQVAYEVWALNSAFSTKDILRARRYQWHAEPDKCWVGTVAGADLETELSWLGQEVYAGKGARIEVGVLDAVTRFSTRRVARELRMLNEPVTAPVTPPTAVPLPEQPSLAEWI